LGPQTCKTFVCEITCYVWSGLLNLKASTYELSVWSVCILIQPMHVLHACTHSDVLVVCTLNQPRSILYVGVLRQQSYCHSGFVTLPSVGAVP